MRRKPTTVISVLVASRGRPNELRENLLLLRRNCSRWRDVELLVRTDEDDHESQRVASSLGGEVYVGQSVGWRNAHLLYNDLASHARGRWLFVLSDDAKVETRGWDRTLAGVRDKLCLVKFEDGWRPGPNFPCFPVVPRLVYEAMGHLSQSPHIGLWLDEVVRQRAGFALKYFPHVCIRHVKPRPEADTDTVNESYEDFYSLEGEEARAGDSRKVIDFYGRQPGAKPRSASLEQKLDSISRRWFLSALHR